MRANEPRQGKFKRMMNGAATRASQPFGWTGRQAHEGKLRSEQWPRSGQGWQRHEGKSQAEWEGGEVTRAPKEDGPDDEDTVAADSDSGLIKPEDKLEGLGSDSPKKTRATPELRLAGPCSYPTKHDATGTPRSSGAVRLALMRARRRREYQRRQNGNGCHRVADTQEAQGVRAVRERQQPHEDDHRGDLI